MLIVQMIVSMCYLNKFNGGFKLWKQSNDGNVIHHDFTLQIILHAHKLWRIQEIDLPKLSPW